MNLRCEYVLPCHAETEIYTPVNKNPNAAQHKMTLTSESKKKLF